ncbi:conserved Plasmodium protein, unknown function [Plasmodium gallinaceum]|uniref:Uncharacterized protein n=1 Tax=Plasmodium gallinaceum TaxID=5849 RepID=A0A1J1GWZ8_PLAGA|nr:conserved Plasmodium protein, unknown function [Plasmodium gallinaceum]CRG97073.1 conserved Plasmodium protein, unknown function [Plasmodium gallinaceum]
MPKQRGFRPQGLIAPIQRIKYNGPTLLDKINRETRPTWDDLKDRIKNQEGNKMLEEYENAKYIEELNKNREEKIKEQEKRYIKKLKKEYKKKYKKKSDDNSTDSSDDDISKKRKRKRKKKKKKDRYSHSLSSDTTSNYSDKKKHKKQKKNDDINPFKLSNFFKMK